MAGNDRSRQAGKAPRSTGDFDGELERAVASPSPGAQHSDFQSQSLVLKDVETQRDRILREERAYSILRSAEI